MGKYILKRLGYGLITLAAISVIIFSVIHLLPGDPIQIMFGKNPVPELIEIARKYYGLDKPIWVQYFSWLNKVAHGNLGYSIVNNLPVLQLVLPRIGRTIMLTMGGIAISLLIAFPTGLLAAARHNTWSDLSISSVSLVLISIPEFWIGIVYMMIFAVWLAVLPTSGYFSPFVDFRNFIRIMILPAATVASVQAAQTTRMTRANMLEVLRLDYVTLMKAMGIRGSRILVVHAFRNALIPVLTLIGMQAGALMGGVVIVEKVFTYPGLGLLMIKSLQERDYPVVQACIMVYAIMFVVINIVVDIVYSIVNPKIRY